MYFEFKDSNIQSLLRLTDNVGLITEEASIKKGLIHIIWNRTEKTTTFYVDEVSMTLAPNQITTVTYLHGVRFPEPLPNLTVVSFNREFYCIKDHDYEVSCNGILFMGSRDIPVIDLDSDENEKMHALIQVFEEEFSTRDNIQGEMLQMLLKRLIIKCTRLVKAQSYKEMPKHESIDLIRRFNILVDDNFKSLKKVSDYADLLNKSPKTLANIFKSHGDKTPLQLIHERLVLEAQRLLVKTDYSAKEIAFVLGFSNVTSFHKLFRKIAGISPNEYRNSSNSGKIDSN